MAKQKNTAEESTTEEVVTPFQDSTETPEPQRESEPASQAAQAPKEKQSQEEPDEFVKSILSSFSHYKTLYVDRHGGVFTADTPENIRGGATLFTNPYYKS